VGGVIVIPPKCLQSLPERLPDMRAFECKVHSMLRQTGIPIAEKRRLTAALLSEFGFAKPAST